MNKIFFDQQTPTPEFFPISARRSKIRFVIGIATLGVLTGCVGYVEERPHRAAVYAEPQTVYAPAPPVYVAPAPTVYVEEEYVYYPNYEVYYSGRTRQYSYREGSSWVTRPAPPRVSVNVLLGSPSVRTGFRDAPAAHHEHMVRTYPRNWTPPVPQRRDGRRDER
jgi:hypothetical protein